MDTLYTTDAWLALIAIPKMIYINSAFIPSEIRTPPNNGQRPRSQCVSLFGGFTVATALAVKPTLGRPTANHSRLPIIYRCSWNIYNFKKSHRLARSQTTTTNRTINLRDGGTHPSVTHIKSKLLSLHGHYSFVRIIPLMPTKTWMWHNHNIKPQRSTS